MILHKNSGLVFVGLVFNDILLTSNMFQKIKVKYDIL